MLGADGRNCERIWEIMQALVEEREPNIAPPARDATQTTRSAA